MIFLFTTFRYHLFSPTAPGLAKLSDAVSCDPRARDLTCRVRDTRSRWMCNKNRTPVIRHVLKTLRVLSLRLVPETPPPPDQRHKIEIILLLFITFCSDTLNFGRDLDPATGCLFSHFLAPSIFFLFDAFVRLTTSEVLHIDGRFVNDPNEPDLYQ